MDFTQAFEEVEALYRRVLALTLCQEEGLRTGELGELPAIAQEQMQLLARADTLMAAINAAAARSDPAFQEGVRSLAAILTEVVASEERCKSLAPAPPAPLQPPPARVLAAYGRK